MRATFPPLPDIAAGQVFSAAVLRHAHKAAIEYLLGESHATFPLAHVRVPSTDVYQSTYQTIWEAWALHASQAAFYRLQIKVNYGDAVNRTWWYLLQVSPDGGSSWLSVKEESGTQNTYQMKEGEVDVSGLGLTLGQVYKWRLQVAVTGNPEPADAQVHCIPWAIGTRGAVSGWAAPPTFVAGVSDPAHANALAADAYRLYAALPATSGATTQPARTEVVFPGAWTELTRAVYRYRQGRLRVGVAGSAWADTTWQWRVKVETDTASAVVYTSALIAGDEAIEPEDYDWTTHQETIDLAWVDGPAYAALQAAGITLTHGAWYRVVVEIDTPGDPGRAWAVGAMVERLTNLYASPQAGYTVPHVWSHGDQDVGPTNLNVYSADLTALYSGSEALHYDAPAVDVAADGWGHTLVHRKRYLRYLAPEGATLHHGAGLGESVGLEASSAWAYLDLETTGLAYGTSYWVYGAIACMEADSA
jgi:hypothetical protein